MNFCSIMNTKNRITQLFKIEHPIIQAGMVWCSGWELAAAVSNAGGLGIIGAGSMSPDILLDHIQKVKKATDKPFAVNLPLLYSRIEDQIDIIIKSEVPIVFTSAGNPSLHTPRLKQAGIIVAHVVSSAKFAKKAHASGVDAIVAEGFEAGGHNGKDETTTLCLIPQVVDAVPIPVIAAGGIADGRSMLAVMALGAEGVQIGSRFVASAESSAHEKFKQAIVTANEGDTELTLKELTPVRLLKNEFYQKIMTAYSRQANKDELAALLGKGRAKLGMFEGDLNEGELEIGQVSASIREILPAGEIVRNILSEYENLGGQKLGGYFDFKATK
jgi:enoyl-[acyl-carrier protein] reductase II